MHHPIDVASEEKLLSRIFFLHFISCSVFSVVKARAVGENTTVRACAHIIVHCALAGELLQKFLHSWNVSEGLINLNMAGVNMYFIHSDESLSRTFFFNAKLLFLISKYHSMPFRLRH